MTTTDEIQIHRGLSGVYFDRSETSFIDGRAGKLQYRGYSIDDLATHSTFEETAYLLLYGALPTRAQLAAFDAELKAARPISGEILDVIRLVQAAHPMDVLRTAVSRAGGVRPRDGGQVARGDAAQGAAPHRAGSHDRDGTPRDPSRS